MHGGHKLASGGGISVSIDILKAFSTIYGIILYNTGLLISKHGFVFISIKYGLND